jgi:hypothetical protein
MPDITIDMTELFDRFLAKVRHRQISAKLWWREILLPVAEALAGPLRTGYEILGPAKVASRIWLSFRDSHSSSTGAESLMLCFKPVNLRRRQIGIIHGPDDTLELVPNPLSWAWLLERAHHGEINYG